jgi:hypothetical protein
MRKGVVIIRPPEGTVRQQSQICLALSHNGFSVAPRTRFDNLLVVAFERDDDAPDVEEAALHELFKSLEDFETSNLEIKVLA